MEDAFADLEQLLPRFRNCRHRQQPLWGDCFQASLGFVQVIQRALQAGDQEAGFSMSFPTSNAVQGSSQFYARSLEFEDELLQILVAGLLKVQLADLA